MTGATGRLAACIRPSLESAGLQVIPVDRSRVDELEFIPGDALLHLAWSSYPATAERLGPDALGSDQALLDRLLNRVTRSSAPPYVVFFSSGGVVYGPHQGVPRRESDPCQPIGAYGRAKLAAENLLRERAERSFPLAILRISNPYGFPLPPDRVQGIIPHAFRAAITGQPLAIWGDGKARKDFIHHSDLTAALDAILVRGLVGTYNVASGESRSIADVLRLVEQITGRKIHLTFEPAPRWDVVDCALDISALKQATGWAPKVSLDEGLRRSAGLLAARIDPAVK